MSSALGTAKRTHTDGNEEMVITRIRATDVTLGLRRLPAGFYSIVYHGGLEWRTENKRLSVNDDVVEWNGPIPIPSDLSATICIKVCASFEFQPTLGVGEKLRKLTVTVKQLLDRSTKDVPFTLFPKDGDVVSPCSSILVTVERWACDSSDSSESSVFDPDCSATESQSKLEEATNQGHIALSRYQKHGKKRDLEHSIKQFKRALNICPLDHPGRAAAQSNLATAKFILFQVKGANVSFSVPLRLYYRALAARPVGHPDRPSTLIRIAAVHFARLEKLGDIVGGEWAVELLREAIECSPTKSHENQVATVMLQLHAVHSVDSVQVDGQPPLEQNSDLQLTSEDPWTLAVQLMERFKRFGDLADLQHAIALLQELVRSTPVEDVRRRGGLANLGLALLYRFDHERELHDLEDAISMLGSAVDLTPSGHPDKPTLLNSLGLSLFTRLKSLGEPSDLDDAISTLQEAVNLTPDGHSHKPACLGNLGNSFLARFERLGELSDLDMAVSSHRGAANLTHHDHPDRHGHLNGLGSSLHIRFERLGELSDLEEAISTLRDAVDLTPDDHPHKATCLGNLANTLEARFERFGQLSDLGVAILMHKDAADRIPRGHSDKSSHLNNLGHSLATRFQHLGKPSDLEDAISILKDATELILDTHPSKPSCLTNLGNSFLARFEFLGKLSDLEDAISTLEDAINLTPNDHPDRLTRRNNLGNALVTRFKRHGGLSDIEDAIVMLTDSVDLTPPNHPAKCRRLTSLGNSLFTRFKRLGELGDLDEAISRHKNAVDLTPREHIDIPSYLNSLGNSLFARFGYLGKSSDLEDAVSRYREAVDLTPGDHPDKPIHLNNLGSSLFTRFTRLGELSDLEEAISTRRNAVDLTPPGHPDKPRYLSNLGSSFKTRFECLGELSDLEDAISMHIDAVDSTPRGHPDKLGYLNNLGNAFSSRFGCLEELSDLEDAISALKDAVEFAPHGHPDKPTCLSNLGSCFRARYEYLKEPSDLEVAILTLRGAVDLTHDDHPDKPALLNSLGLAFFTRFKSLSELDDLEEAISRHKDAVDLTPYGHYDKPGYLSNVADVLLVRFGFVGERSNLEQAISLYSHAASSPIGPISVRFSASQKWITSAQGIQHHSLLHAYSIAIGLLPQLAWIGLSLTHRYQELRKGADVVREAAAAAVDSGLLETAVEWLEQGRSIVWGELLQLRNPYEELSSAYPDHVRRLRELSVELEHAGAIRERSLSTLSERTESATRRAMESLKADAGRHRALAIERDKLLQEIRSFPGFKQFLLHKQFSQLRASAHAGPVVILNAAENHCDALIVVPDVDQVIHVPLPSFTVKRSAGLQNALKGFVRSACPMRSDEREGQSAAWNVSWESILSPLWKCVIKPVLDASAFSTPGDLSRIFWCPTGPFAFLPIHAAGFYDMQYSQPGQKVFDFVISSYVPTLAILSPSSNSAVLPGDSLRLLAVRQPPSDGLSRLPGVEIELEHIKELVQSSTSACTTLLESSLGTVEEVLDLMKQADWVHFACHGAQDAADSGLCLADRRRLKLRDIIALSRPHGGLAFLSACQTAMGHQALSDEAIHIAAGMLFAGYGGVIGTMWSISDRLAPGVARDVYEQLFQKGTRPDYREAARALHEATGRLRDSGVSFTEWLPFIHVGL